ncbi:MAG: hypothetical protein OES47_12970 [Acidobacteriota bacterium]|nr:hypothetical protein [Acidobacteriota bacterium]
MALTTDFTAIDFPSDALSPSSKRRTADGWELDWQFDHLAFAISSVVSIALVVSYLRLVCGIRQALLYAGGSQFVWLVLFSYAFFYDGYTGLTITVGAILTLFLLMQLTARVNWEAAFARKPPSLPEPV